MSTCQETYTLTLPRRRFQGVGLLFFMGHEPLGVIVLFDLSGLKAATAAVFIASVGVGNAATVDVTVGEAQWRIGTLTGPFNSFAATLNTQPWWGNQSLAREFAGAVRLSLGIVSGPNVRTPAAGPLFAYVLDLNPTVGSAYCFSILEGTSCVVQTSFVSPASSETVWATATRIAVEDPVNVIPVPAGLPLLLAGIGGLAALRMRKPRAPRA
jgi:hypothetical protein